MALLGLDIPEDNVVHIPFPDGERRGLKIGWMNCGGYPQGIFASVTKDAGDDPDVTHGAEIIAKVVLTFREEAKWQNGKMVKWASDAFPTSPFRDFAISSYSAPPPIIIRGGKGVGRVTRPGLPVPVGEAAINPGPRQMIRDAVIDAFQAKEDHMRESIAEVEVTIWVPEGESIAQKTLNSRLGIIGGISILGTTGIVRPISTEAWTATIATSMDVARAMGRKEIVISSGRSSEKAHMEKYAFPEESYVMMGDYVEFALLEAKRHGFTRVHLVAQWAKMLKAAMAIPQTHVRHGAINMKITAAFLRQLGFPEIPDREFNTAREMFEVVSSLDADAYRSLLLKVCSKAQRYAESITEGIPVTVHLVSYEREIIAQNG
jgi:cobalt-precorrin-5B (C1)-methyltransferase